MIILTYNLTRIEKKIGITGYIFKLVSSIVNV